MSQMRLCGVTTQSTELRKIKVMIASACISMAAQTKIPRWMILSQALGWEMPLFGAPKLPFPSPVNNVHATTESKLRLASTETFRNENTT